MDAGTLVLYMGGAIIFGVLVVRFMMYLAGE